MLELHEGTESFQDELRCRDGRIFIRRSVAFRETQASYLRIWIFTEVTAQKQAETASAECEAWQQAIFASMGEGLIAHRLLYDDRPGPFEHVNPAWRRNLGYTEAELARLSPAEIDDPAIASGVIAEVIAKLKTCGSACFESVQLRKDGSKIPVAVNARLFEFHGQRWIISVLHDTTEQKAREQEREHLISELERQLAEIETLRGILPICAYCKKIRDDQGYWEQVEVYIHKHSKADFSHGVCPECMKQHYPEIYREIQAKADSKPRLS